MKKLLDDDNLYDIWPNFEPKYDEREYAWIDLKDLGKTLLLNCGFCDGPSDMRHNICNKCVIKRKLEAQDEYHKIIEKTVSRWSTTILCRIHTE